MQSTITFNIDEKAATIFIMKIYENEVEQVWNHFTQAQLLDLWWAPKPWKCETIEMDFRPNGFWKYAMIGPEGEKHSGMTKYNDITPNRNFNWTDFFLDDQGKINTELPTTNTLIGFTGIEEGTKLTMNIHFRAPEELHQLLEMGVEQGFKSSLNQLESLLSKNARL